MILERISGGRPGAMEWLQSLQGGMGEYISGAPHLALAAAFAAGVATSFTPCVYPMVPLTAGYVGGRSAGGSVWRGFMLSLFYVLGLAVVYSSLGAAAALTGQLFGRFASSPWTNFAVANVCILMGLSMFGLFEIQAPMFLRKRQAAGGGGGSVVGAFVVGAFSAIVAAPCTAPVLGVILSFVAKGRNVAWGMALLFVFALGMGALLVIVGTFAGAVSALPQSGAWMVKVKIAFGVVMIAVGEYFLITAGKMFI